VRAAFRILGFWARWALPAGVCLGLIWPALAHALQPLLPIAVISTLTAALLRLNWQQLGYWFSHPRLPLLLVITQLLVSPVVVALLARVGLIPEALIVITVLQAAGAPIGSAAAFALFLGRPGHLSMIGSVLGTLLLPITLTLVVSVQLPSFGIEVALLPFFLRVAQFALAPFLIAWLLRRLVGIERLRQLDAELAGINVLALVIFAIAIMQGVTEAFVADPHAILVLFGWSCLAAFLWHLLGYFAFRPLGADAALSAALMLGNRNMGLLLVVTAGTVGPSFQMYCGLAQIPMYCVPLILGAIMRAPATDQGDRA
jgi:BASS family bile acid:Na+ symporter